MYGSVCVNKWSWSCWWYFVEWNYTKRKRWNKEKTTKIQQVKRIQHGQPRRSVCRFRRKKWEKSIELENNKKEEIKVCLCEKEGKILIQLARRRKVLRIPCKGKVAKVRLRRRAGEVILQTRVATPGVSAESVSEKRIASVTFGWLRGNRNNNKSKDRRSYL